MSSYDPKPIDTSGQRLGPELLRLTEMLARNTHDNWAQRRMAEGWRWGPERDDTRRLHPCLVPYEELPESEKDLDRGTAMETLKAITALGFRIVKS